jgi:hypothetical protein
VQKPTDRGRRASQGTVPAHRNDLLRRGVWQAPFFGPDGELALVAVSRAGKLIGDVLIVPHGSSRIAAAEALLERLNLVDPLPAIRIV